MRNRLTFPEGGMETKYVWDKYSLNNNGIYIWDKHQIKNTYLHSWNKYSVREKEYEWKQYTVIDGAKGEYVGIVEDANGEAYPQDGIQNGYWYEIIRTGTYYWDVYDTKNKYKWNEYSTKVGDVSQITVQKYELSPNIKIKMSSACQIIAEDGSFQHSAIWLSESQPEDEQTFTLYFAEDDGSISTKTVNLYQELANSNYNWETYIYCRYSNNIIAIGNDTMLALTMGQPYDGTPSIEKISEDEFEVFGFFLVQGYTIMPKPLSWSITDDDVTMGASTNIVTNAGGIKKNNLLGTYTYSKGNNTFDYLVSQSLIDANAGSCDDTNDWLTTCFKDPVNEVYWKFTNIQREITKDVIIQEVSDDNKDAYPSAGFDADQTRYYEYIGYDVVKGDTYIGRVEARDESVYPKDEISGNEYYDYITFIEDTYELDQFIEVVKSYNANEYPRNNIQDGYWYIYWDVEVIPVAGDYIGEVNTEKKRDYPLNGVQDGYYYIFNRYENEGPYQSVWISSVESNEQVAFPQNGISGYYWYVYKKSYQGYKYQITDEYIRGGINYKLSINPDEDFTIGCVGSAEIEFDYDNRNNDIEQYLDLNYCDYWTWQPNDNDWRKIGRFYIDNVKHNRKLVNILAFDTLGSKSEIFVDDFISNYNFPATLTDFYLAVCAEMGVSGTYDVLIENKSFMVQDNFEAINITARQLLQYIAEVAGGFIKAEPDGSIYLTTYRNKINPLTNSQYTNSSIANYTIEKIDGLTVRTTEDDLGASYGNKNAENRYIIQNNPLFYAQSEDELYSPVYYLYSALHAITYTPAEVELLQDFGIECGDIITLNGQTFYVMEKELSASGCKLRCKGNKVRAKQESTINSDIVALRGKTNELYRDLEMTQSTLTDTANGLQSQITQTAEEINLRVTNEVEGLESEISQTAEQISLRVTNEVAGLESKITQTADSITSTVTDQINETKSEIKQTTDSISLKVDNQGELVAQLVLDVNGINARGYVTFTDLAGTGTTVINGSNITTGTISADRINMRGAISWGDLDEDCKDTIASYAGADGDDANVPDYIHNTYIDAVTIKSPTIQGGTLSAGTTADGYCYLSSTGFNFHSSEKPICGIGYYSAHKELPYILLGGGIDEWGTDTGMIKKYTNGIWIGDNDGLSSTSPSGTGIFINFNTGAIQKYVNGTVSAL